VEELLWVKPCKHGKKDVINCLIDSKEDILFCH